MRKTLLLMLISFTIMFSINLHAADLAASDEKIDRPAEKTADPSYKDENAENDSADAYRGQPGRSNDLMFLAGISYKTDNFWRGSDYYGRKAGASSAFVNIYREQVNLQIMYEHPGLSILESDPEHYDALYLGLSCSLLADMPFITYFRLLWKYMPEADEVNTSGYITGTAGITSNTSIARISLSYSRDYYTDDLNGDRETLRDYLIKLNLGLHESRSLIAFGYMNINFYAEYFNNEFADSRATPGDESRKGISDIACQYILGFYMTEGVVFYGECNYAYMPDSDWNRYVKSRYWYGFGFNVSY